ncbi:MAG: type IV pilus assembly protein PilM [Candidatus Komeilibacteria bacterium]
MAKLNNFIALDISDNSLEVMECQRDFWGRYVIKKVNRITLEKGIILNGEIKNANALLKAIKKLLSTAKPSAINTYNCFLSIPENKVFTHIFHVPVDLKDADIEDFLLNQSEGIIPFNRETVISDYKIVDQNEKEKTVFYAAAPRKLVMDTLAILKDAKLNVMLIELESYSVARSLMSKADSKDVNMIIDIGGNFSNIAIYDKQGLKLTVSLPMAGNQFTKEIRTKAKLTVAKANELKTKEGLNSSNKNAVKALQNSIDKIVEEILRSVKYFEKKTDQKFKKIILVGGSSRLPGIVDYLADKTGLPVEIGNPWHRLKKSPEILKIFTKSKGMLYSTVIGLMLRGKQKDYRQGINLLPAKGKKKNIIQLSSGNKQDWIKYVIFILLVIAFVSLIIFKEDIRGGETNKPSTKVDIYEEMIPMVVSYNPEVIKDASLARVKGEIIEQSGEATLVWDGVTTDQLTILANDYLVIYNESEEDLTLVANSRLSAGDEVYYLKEPLHILPGDSSVVQVVKEEGDVNLKEGVYNFIALSEDRQKLVYGKKELEVEIIPPEQISQVDVTGIISLQEGLRQETQNNSFSSLPKNIYINEPIQSRITSIKYINMGDKKVGMKMSVNYQWVSLVKDDLIEVFSIKLTDKSLLDKLNNASFKVNKQSINETEKAISVEVIASFY